MTGNIWYDFVHLPHVQFWIYHWKILLPILIVLLAIQWFLIKRRF